MATIWSIITWAVFGLIIGTIARFIYPGKQSMSLVMTMLLGIVGSLVGGFIAWGFGFEPERGAFRGAGWIMSILGALIVVGVSLYLANKRGTAGRGMP
jgi:uncharacterized membrane protein YeaQ/YmgE (transglycosylase-associated protein family)